MDIGGFASCHVCAEYLWIPGDSQGLCVECHERASAARPDPPPAEHVRKKVERKFEKGKLGAKPKRAALAGLARALWDEFPPMGQDPLVDDLQVLGCHSTKPFEAMVDFCEVTVLKRRNALKKEKKTADKPTP
jgi:hypothetical protein